MRDVADIDHDARLISAGKPIGLKMIHADHPCRMPGRCSFDGRVCKTCGRKRGPDVRTLQMMDLARAVRGGMPLQASDVSMAQWDVLGELKRRDDLMLRSAVGMFG